MSGPALVLFWSARGIRYAQDELAFRNADTVYAGIHSELHQVVHLRQFFSAQRDLFPGSNGSKEFHASDRGEKKERPASLAVTGSRRDAGRLGERFGKDDAGHKGIARKMTGENGIIRGKRGDGFRRNPRVALAQLAHENKRRAMGKAKKVTCDVGHVTSS